MTFVRFSPDGKLLATACKDGVALWDAASGQAVGEGFRHGQWVNTIDFSPDGKRVVTASDDNTACIWEVASGNRLTPEPLRHGDWVRVVDDPLQVAPEVGPHRDHVPIPAARDVKSLLHGRLQVGAAQDPLQGLEDPLPELAQVDPDGLQSRARAVEDLIDINDEKQRTIDGLRYTPAAALGTCRYKIDFKKKPERAAKSKTRLRP